MGLYCNNVLRRDVYNRRRNTGWIEEVMLKKNAQVTATWTGNGWGSDITTCWLGLTWQQWGSGDVEPRRLAVRNGGVNRGLRHSLLLALSVNTSSAATCCGASYGSRPPRWGCSYADCCDLPRQQQQQQEPSKYIRMSEGRRKLLGSGYGCSYVMMLWWSFVEF